MSDKYFVDTNILMYAHDKAAGAKHERARALMEELWRDRTGVVSTQVLQELAVNLRKKARKPLDTKATREVIADYLTWQVIVNGGDSILGALDLEERYQVSFWDALALYAAHASLLRFLSIRLEWLYESSYYSHYEEGQYYRGQEQSQLADRRAERGLVGAHRGPRASGGTPRAGDDWRPAR